MKFLIILICVIALNIATTSAAVAMNFYRDPEHPGKCVLKDQGLILSPGDTVPTKGYCGSITCGENGFTKIFTCGILIPADGCKIKEPASEALYPDCCPHDVDCK